MIVPKRALCKSKDIANRGPERALKQGDSQ
jgi:hypothetical protein